MQKNRTQIKEKNHLTTIKKLGNKKKINLDTWLLGG